MEILTTASWTRGAEPEGGEAAAGMMPFPRMARGGEGWEGKGGAARKGRRVKMSSDVAAVMKREANDWRQEVEKRGAG